MNTACLLLAACLAMAAATTQERWELYKQKHNKNYPEHLERIKREIWRSNVELIEKHNARFARSLENYTLGENQFTDEDPSILYQDNDFYEEDEPTHCSMVFKRTPNITLPEAVDWRPKGYVTPVKNQELCGSCWAFSAVGSLEGQHYKATGKLVNLSESNLVDCSAEWGNDGCEGGNIDQAFRYIIDNKGINTADSYPYTPKQGLCKFSKNSIGATMTGYACLPAGDEDALKEAVATVGPVSVAIDSRPLEFKSYKFGVLYSASCSSTRLTHAVLVVGYGRSNGMDYWIVKNSWGTGWGDSGYVLMSRNRNNNCGIATQAFYPVAGGNTALGDTGNAAVLNETNLRILLLALLLAYRSIVFIF
ncbi:procathepsin L-like [Physella acuta]|uniref:procathepsin L-like n=1 Tax=Physella acuta TaxID=109671 RepID=UPI0027DE7CA3|nr:procathepsin L-like [Physella acuta]XP_059138705.1 procathepsin L-like [Physella acuta]